MEICIPLNEANWEAFYYKAKAAGVSLKSRYEGVMIILHRSTRLPAFLARHYDELSGRKDIEYFPLTKEGEQQAKEAYDAYIERLGKRRSRKNKQYEKVDTDIM